MGFLEDRGHFLTRPVRVWRVTEPPTPNRAERRADRSQTRRRRATPDARPARAPAFHVAEAPRVRAPEPILPDPTVRRECAVPRRGRWLGLVSAALLTLTLGTVAFSGEAEAQQRRTRLKPQDLTLKGSVAARPLVLLGALGILTLLPFVIIMVTSFV